MSGFNTDLLTGLAELLAAGGLGATWNPSGGFPPLALAVVLATVPEAPERVITLTAYSVSDDPSLSNSVVGVQVRCRWGGKDPRPVDDLQDAIYNLLHGKTNFMLGTVPVVECLRHSAIGLGQDGNLRWYNSANYYLTVHRPSTHRS